MTIGVKIIQEIEIISIHTLCEEGDVKNIKVQNEQKISIHTLCEEGDNLTGQILKNVVDFNPHPLWRGWLDQFQSLKKF